jgi:stage II sporulation protein P
LKKTKRNIYFIESIIKCMNRRLTKMRRRQSKLKSIFLVTGSILISPVVASGVVKGVSELGSVAALFSEITIGTDAGEKDDRRQPMVSHGFGWNDEYKKEPVLKGDKNLVPYPEITDVRSGNVIMQTFGEYSGNEYFDLEKCGQVRNCTDESTNVLLAQSRLEPEFSVKLNSTPQVLIMHTHTTESFEPFEREYYDASFSYRTSDESMNVVAIGEEMKVQIESCGISVIHDTTIHDYPSYNGSYERSAETVKKILSEMLSIFLYLNLNYTDYGEKGYRAKNSPISSQGELDALLESTISDPSDMDGLHCKYSLGASL